MHIRGLGAEDILPRNITPAFNPTLLVGFGGGEDEGREETRLGKDADARVRHARGVDELDWRRAHLEKHGERV